MLSTGKINKLAQFPKTTLKGKAFISDKEQVRLLNVAAYNKICIFNVWHFDSYKYIINIYTS